MSIWTPPVSPFGRCARCTGSTSSPRCIFDNVVVPADRMLGKPGDGWGVAMDLLPHERSTCFWHRIAYLFTRLDRLLVQSAPTTTVADDAELGAAYLALHTIRCRSRMTQQRLADGAALGPETSVDKVLLATAEQQLFNTARDLLPGAIELSESEWRIEYLLLARRDHLRRHRGDPAQHHRAATTRPREGVKMDNDELLLLTETFRKAMTGSSGPELDAALVEPRLDRDARRDPGDRCSDGVPAPR